MSELAPAARMRRRTDADRAHAPAIEAAIERWERHAGGERGGAAAWWEEIGKAILLSPFWIERLREHGISPRAIRSEADLRVLPVLTRAEVAAQSARMVAVDPAGAPGLVIVESSGATGAPVKVVRGDLECLLMWGCARFWAARHGVALSDRARAVLLCTLPSGLEYSRRAPLFLRGAIHRISTVRDGARSRLAKVAPSMIFTDPEGLRWLVERDAVTARIVASSAQALPSSLRSRVPAPLVDYYATTETGPIAWSCPRAPERFHVLGPDVIVESVGGALVVTRLRPSPWLLLRYATGDRGRVVDEACECGFVGRSIVELVGRGHVRFARADGSLVDPWRLAFVFKHRGLRDFRLAQIAVDRFVLEVVGEDPEIGARVARGLEALGFEEAHVELRFMDRIDHGVKVAPFVSAV
ncbi:MAG: coenzyme synthetase [Sandaracinaceae bacterium]|nr:coenzyme synthetase [Sandaracinaceae bacterium]